MASFADPSDLVKSYDSRRVRELCSDTGTPVAIGDIDTDPVLLMVLARATETVLAYARKGERYEESELQELADSATAGFALTGLVCDLAFGYLTLRRGTGAADWDRLSPAYKAALATLEELANGTEVFARIDGDAHPDAGTPRTASLTQQVTSPTYQCSWSQQASRNLLPVSPTTNPDCC